MIEIQALKWSGNRKGRLMPLWNEDAAFCFSGTPAELLAMRAEAIAFGIHLQNFRGHNAVIALGNSDFADWMSGNERGDGCTPPSEVVKATWKILRQATPMAHGTVASAPIRYREETADGKDWLEWVYLDGIDEQGNPQTAPRPSKAASPNARAAKKERKAEAHLREVGLIS